MSSLLGNLKKFPHPHILSISSSRFFYKSYSTLTVIYHQDFNSCSAEVINLCLISEIKRNIYDNSNIKDLMFVRIVRHDRKMIFTYDHSARYFLKKTNGYLML